MIPRSLWRWGMVAAVLLAARSAAADDSCADLRLLLAVREGAGWREVGDLRFLPDGGRLMHRLDQLRPRDTPAYRRRGGPVDLPNDYSVVRVGEREERFLVHDKEGAAIPVLAIERDGGERATREVVRRVPLPDESRSLMEPSWILKWFEYARDRDGRLAGLTLHAGPGKDNRWLTEDDEPSARVSITRGSGGQPTEAIVTLPRRSELDDELVWRSADHVRFLYDREGLWQGTISDAGQRATVVSGRCRAVPARALELLLSPLTSPFQPTLSRESLR